MKQFDFTVPNSFIWTASEFTAKALEEMPSVELVEYQQNSSGILQGINYWQNMISSGGGGDNPYQGLYVAKKTGGEYIFPFYSQYNQTIQQTWNASEGMLGDKLGNAKKIIEGFGKYGAPTAGIVRPQSWGGVTPATVSFELYLLNTTSAGYTSNMELLKQLTKQNLHEQSSFLNILPPCLYSVNVPGVRYSPVSVVSNLAIDNMGTINKIDNFNIPDAWKLSMVFTELIAQSRNLYDEVWNSSGANVAIEAPTPEQEAIQAGLTAATNDLTGAGFTALQTLIDTGKNLLGE